MVRPFTQRVCNRVKGGTVSFRASWSWERNSIKGDKESRERGRAEREQRWGTKEAEILRDVGQWRRLGAESLKRGNRLQFAAKSRRGVKEERERKAGAG